MKVLVTGYSGQLGYDVVREGKARGYEMYGTSSLDLDIRDKYGVYTYVEMLKPNVIIHCAAYTAVDKAEDETGMYLRVIDYKSSEKELNLTEVYYGLALQMLTYLDIIITHSPHIVGKTANPAGVLYFHVHNPIINASRMLTIDEIEAEIMKQFKMNGLLLSDENVIRLMDRSLDNGSSQIISAGFKKDGSLTKASKVASQEDFVDLRSYIRNKYVETGNDIISGVVDIDPFKLKDKLPCTFCSFKSVCQFDRSIDSNEYRKLTPKSKEDILEAIRKDGVDLD